MRRISSNVANGRSKSTCDRSTRILLSVTKKPSRRQTGSLSFDLAPLGPLGAGIGGTFAMIGFFVRAMRLGHDEISFGRGNPPDYQLRAALRRLTPIRRRSVLAAPTAADTRPVSAIDWPPHHP